MIERSAGSSKHAPMSWTPLSRTETERRKDRWTQRTEIEPTPMKHTRRWNGGRAEASSRVRSTLPARIELEAWTKPELIKRWWVPKSSASPAFLRNGCSCRGHVPLRVRPRCLRADGVLRQVHRSGAVSHPSGRMRKVTKVAGHHSDLRGARRQNAPRHHELYPSKEALDAAGAGTADATVETFVQLDELLVTLGAGAGAS